MKKKQMFFEIIAILIVLVVFTFGWIYLELIFIVTSSSFDFNIYFKTNEGAVNQKESITSTIIVFSKSEKIKPVELYVSNCPQYSECTFSVNSANPTYTSDLTITTSDLTPEGVYPLNIFATGGGINKAATYYLTVTHKECICTPWVSLGCGGYCDSQMYVVRVCNPKGCDTESRCAYNSSCIKDFSIVSIPAYTKAVNQKASFTIEITSVNDFSGLVYLSLSNCPRGSSCSLSSNSVDVPLNSSASSILNINTALGAVIGNFNITTTAVSNDITHSTNSTITIA